MTPNEGGRFLKVLSWLYVGTLQRACGNLVHYRTYHFPAYASGSTMSLSRQRLMKGCRRCHSIPHPCPSTKAIIRLEGLLVNLLIAPEGLWALVRDVSGATYGRIHPRRNSGAKKVALRPYGH